MSLEQSVPAWLVDLFAHYGYFVVVAGAFLENAGVPVPGETALLAGAALARFGRLSLFWVIVAGFGAATVGDNVGFWVGRHGGRPFAERHGWKVGLTAARLNQFDRFFAQHGAKTVFIARFVTGLRVFGAVLAGGSGLPWSRFLCYNATGAAAWATAVGVTGYALAYSWETLARWIGHSGLVALALVALVAAIAWARRQKSADS